MRLDKYLKVSRLIKRRTVANEACDAGRVTVNGKVAKASQDVKVGDKIKATFRKYGKHEVIGEVFDVSKDEDALPGTWVSIRVIGGDMNDSHVALMVNNKINCMMPLSDIKEVLA